MLCSVDSGVCDFNLDDCLNILAGKQETSFMHFSQLQTKDKYFKGFEVCTTGFLTHNFIVVTISSNITKVHEKSQMATHGASIDH